MPLQPPCQEISATLAEWSTDIWAYPEHWQLLSKRVHTINGRLQVFAEQRVVGGVAVFVNDALTP